MATMNNVAKRISTFSHEHFTDSIRPDDVVVGPGQVEEAISYLKVPGHIDLSHLSFHALDYEEDRIHDSNTSESSNVVIIETGSIDNSHGQNATTATSSLSSLIMEPDTIPANLTHTVVDIAVFPLPKVCRGHGSCDLSKIGVGLKQEIVPGSSFLSLCNRNTGRLNIVHDLFIGYHTSLEVPRTKAMAKHVHANVQARWGHHDYEIVIANCHEYGRRIRVRGSVVIELDDDFDHYHPARGEHHRGDEGFLVDLMMSPYDYPVIAVVVFLFFTCCFIKIRCTTRTDYEEEVIQRARIATRTRDRPIRRYEQV